MENHLFGSMMPNYLKQILHTQLFSVLNIIFGFGTLFILIKDMPVVEYGEYVLIQGFIALSGLILSQNIYSYARLHIPGATVDKQYGYLKTVITIVFSGYISIILLSKIFNFEESIWQFFEIDARLGYLILIMLSFELINLEFMRFFIAIKKIYLKNYAQFFQKVFVLIAILVLLYLNLLTLTNFLYIFIVGQLLVFISFMSAINIRALIIATFITDVVKKGYQVAIPLLPIGLMSIALNYTDTLMIAKFIDKEHVAQYGFASQIISIAMMMIGSSVVLTLFPYATEAHNSANYKQRDMFLLKMLKFGVVLALVFYAFVYMFSSFFIDLLSLEKYKNVPEYLMVLGLFPLLQIFYNVSSHHLQLLRIFKVQVLIAFSVIILNLVLNYFLIQIYGTIGCAYASLLSYVALALIYVTISLKYDQNIIEVINEKR